MEELNELKYLGLISCKYRGRNVRESFTGRKVVIYSGHMIKSRTINTEIKKALHDTILLPILMDANMGTHGSRIEVVEMSYLQVLVVCIRWMVKAMCMEYLV